MWSLSTIFSVFSVLFWVVNSKSIPFAWHCRFYRSLIYFLWINRNTPAVEANVFRTRVWTSRSPPMECDLNGHKSNSTYFSDLDNARTDLMVDVFKKMLLGTRKESGTWPYLPLGAVVSIFRREIKPFAKYNIKSKIIGWDGKWLFVVSRFELAESAHTCAISISKYVFKLGRKTIAPQDVLKQCGLWSPEVEDKGREGRKKVQGLMDLDQLEEEEF
ncbi:hypothetical protein V1517DRAFT_323591 [Lipomyces orientalis]|uniref:Uncharacterized protein n=1 Tax=Lipomyces orientalis TaxID=1233043 RepID=A0ACC3TMG9_9ASCO